MSVMGRNPVEFDYEKNRIELILNLKYGGETTLLPKTIYFRAKANDLVIKTPAFVDFTIKFIGCQE